MTEPWVKRCPEGHASIQPLVGAGYRCEACDTRYAGDPLDIREVDDFDDVTRPEMPVSSHHHSVLVDLIRHVDSDRRTAVKAKELGDINRVRPSIAVLHRRGHIEPATETSTGNWWRPTDKGRRAVKAAVMDD